MMFNKIAALFNGTKDSAEQVFLRENNIQLDIDKGFIVDGIVVNDLSEGEFKHEVRQFEKSYDNQQAEQISLMV